MNKRITSIMLSVILVLSMLVTAVPVFAAPTDSGVSVSKSKVSPGDTFTATLNVPGTAKQISDMSLKVAFNTTAFELTSYTAPTIAGMAMMQSPVPNANTNGFFSATYDSDSCEADITFTGLALTATFKVKDGVPAGNYDFTVTSFVVGSLTDLGLPDILINEAETKVATVNVVAAPVPATGISLNKSSTTITAGQNETLTATVTPTGCTDPVTWESSDEAVATVDNTGKVTAVAKGTATITAKAGTKSATCTVTVTCAHAHTTDVSAVASTCLVAGHGAYTKCNDCGEIISGSDAALALTDHAYGTWIAEVAATHTSNGTKGHYECFVCHKYFDTEHNEITDLTISNAPHGTAGDTWQMDATNHWKDCVVTGCGVIIESTKAAHSFKWVIDTAATEDTVGSRHEECSVCHYQKASVEIPKLDHTHTGITKHDAVAATCTSKGNVEYWTCSSPKCAGKYYSDAACANEITTIETAIDPNNHTGGTEVRGAIEATCNTAGYTGDTYCLGCNAKIATGTAIAKLTHTHSGTLVSAKEPTFTEEGNKAYYTCSCDKWFEDAACTVEITDHSSVIIPALEYAFTAGNNSSYTKGSGKDFQFTANGSKDDCTGIKIDGTLIDAANYTLESGSTIVTLKNAYVETLSTGEHTIAVVYGDKEATASFKIAAASAQGETPTEPSETNTPTSPQTGDNSNMILWIAMLFVSGTGVFGVTLYGKKKRNRA